MSEFLALPSRSLAFHRNIVISSLRDCGQERGIFLYILQEYQDVPCRAALILSFSKLGIIGTLDSSDDK